MNINEFINETNNIEKFYNSSLNDYAREIWYDNLKDISIDRYKTIVQECFRTQKFMPKLADIIEIKKTVKETKINEKIEACEKCSDGMVLYHKEIYGRKYQFACRCICKLGQRLSRTIPSVQEIAYDK